MSFTKRFPLRNYQFKDDNYLVVDVTKETESKFSFDNPDFYIEYTVQEGETPIIIADKLYDDPELAWAILLFNNIISVYDDWPMDYDSLMKYVQEKYTDIYGIKYYKSISSGNIVNGDHPSYDKIPVTNIEFEVEENDKKRNIKLITSDYIGEYVQAHNNKVEVDI
jgi:hypothetical protein